MESQAGFAPHMANFAKQNGMGFDELRLALEHSGFDPNRATKLAGDFVGFKPILKQLENLNISYTGGLYAKEEKGIDGPSLS